jgi:hypothetical protein
MTSSFLFLPANEWVTGDKLQVPGCRIQNLVTRIEERRGMNSRGYGVGTCLCRKQGVFLVVFEYEHYEHYEHYAALEWRGL